MSKGEKRKENMRMDKLNHTVIPNISNNGQKILREKLKRFFTNTQAWL